MPTGMTKIDKPLMTSRSQDLVELVPLRSERVRECGVWEAIEAVRARKSFCDGKE